MRPIDAKFIAIQVSPTFHAKIKLAAMRQGMSLKEYVTEALAAYLRKPRGGK